MPTLSKSRFVSGNQCEKKLFLDVYRKELKAAITEEQQSRFNIGNQIGILAQNVFPDGKDATKNYDGDWSIAIQKTTEYINAGEKTIYEAAFSIEGGFAALDILHHTNGERWAIEVKSSTGVKEYHLIDAAFQYYVMKNAGFEPDKVFLMHINNQYIKNGAIDVNQLFHLADITEEVLARQSTVESKKTQLISVLEHENEPIREIGPHCNSPFSCDFKTYCWSHIQEQSVFDLYFAKGLDWQLYNQGIHYLIDVQEEMLNNTRQRVHVRGVKYNESQIKETEIQNFLTNFHEPLHFFDFETINGALPPTDGTRPFEQVPFQYSLHITDKTGEIKAHHEFLANPSDFISSENNPRKNLIDQLKKDLGIKGTIVAYNAGFEIGVLNNLAKSFPEESEFIDSLIDRFVDLLIPFKKAWYYLPKMGSSASIKSVLPAIDPEFSYDDLPINNGGLASDTFQNFIFEFDSAVWESKRKELLMYCKRDTEGMVVIYKHLKNLV